MVVLKTEPWLPSPKDGAGKTDLPNKLQPPSSLDLTLSGPEMFGLNDLASDYYQVLIQASRPVWCKTVWGALILWLTCCTVYMIYNLLHDYFQYNTFQDLTLAWPSSLLLPAISICNLSPLNYTAIRGALHGDPRLAEFVEILTELELDLRQEEPTRYEIREEYRGFVEWEREQGSLGLLYPTWASTMLVGRHDYSFRKRGVWVPPGQEHLYWGATEVGACVEVNDDKALVQTLAGPAGGFSIDLDTRLRDYLFTTPSAGSFYRAILYKIVLP